MCARDCAQVTLLTINPQNAVDLRLGYSHVTLAAAVGGGRHMGDVRSVSLCHCTAFLRVVAIC